jgi:glyoxylase-like metal-dependent hydrolase (beta-lactamase superfamily II)
VVISLLRRTTCAADRCPIVFSLGSQVRVVKVGSCTVDPGNAVSPLFIRLKQQLGIGGGSTVTLLRGPEGLLLVDTGYDNEDDPSPANDEANWRRLQARLGEAGVDPAEIAKVFLTHLHRDHAGNLERFPGARWYCPRLALDGYRGSGGERFIPLDEGDRLTRDVVLLVTPGHTRGHGSLLWCAGGVRIAVAGDAILNLAWLQSGHIWRFNGDFYDEAAARESMARLLAAADLVIPGHGEPFFTRGAVPGRPGS